MSCWKERLLLQYLLWKTCPARLNRYLQHGKKAGKLNDGLEVNRRKVRAAAVQQKFVLYRDPLDYAGEMRRQVKKAAGLGAQLVVFPENNGLQLLGMLPGMEKLSAGEKSPKNSESANLPVLEILRYMGPVIEKTVRRIFSPLAARYGIYIMAGSFMHPDGEKIVNRSYLFAPGGDLLGTQDKVHLFPTEKEWGISRGDRFNVFHTPLGVLAMPICMDATYFETFRILQLMGAEIVMVPIANAEPYHFYLALRGIWPRVQETQVYGIRSALVGDFLGFTFTGKAGIFAPLELTPGKNGVLAESDNYEQDDLVTADLDLEALRELRAAHPFLGDLNPELYERYFPDLYSRYFHN
ncbi:MAG: nitrilase [Dethiobacter sp.]|jgi:predicted amidohydrolase|nr:MAG: nitrilase [Dethiobacter sp.]